MCIYIGLESRCIFSFIPPSYISEEFDCFIDAMSIEKCCEIIKNYIGKKKDAHDVLCAESDLQQCCNDFADEIKKQQDAYDTLCPIKGEFMLICLHNRVYKDYNNACFVVLSRLYLSKN